ncbi:flagellar hook-associated protein FlgK [Litorisediminicola beolgyonensis]|uniref:Flagellar hook-associated protein 1 n=1 Tax=Litorisediminicola beolgyonensis TaxID=1173614 RepID=A0ABW3ZFQ3_9RHOB
MTITSAFNTVRTGLHTVGTRAELISSNIANSGREGYVRRDAELSTMINGGVTVAAIERELDTALVGLTRTESASASYHEAVVDSLSIYTNTLGEPGDSESLSVTLAEFQTALDLLGTVPDDIAALKGAVDAAVSLADSLNEASRAVTKAQVAAGDLLKQEIEETNVLLEKIVDLNRQIVTAEEGGMTRASLLDDRDAALDALAERIGITTQSDGQGRIDVLTDEGVALIEGLSFQPISYDAGTGTLSAGAQDITPGRTGVHGTQSGSLSARVTVKDIDLPQMAAQLDEVARALIETFEAADASLAVGQAGLLTDAGGVYDPLMQDGLAGRIAVNDAVRADVGGDPAKLRSGIGALVSAAASDRTQLTSFSDALAERQGFDGTLGLGSNMKLSDYVATLVADQKLRITEAKQDGEARRASSAALISERSQIEGVNVDDELQKLLAVEQAYAANSQVITALTRMMDTLLEAV